MKKFKFTSCDHIVERVPLPMQRGKVDPDILYYKYISPETSYKFGTIIPMSKKEITRLLSFKLIEILETDENL